jgi:hypothetical protein
MKDQSPPPGESEAQRRARLEQEINDHARRQIMKPIKKQDS